jgi:nitrite reductase (NADH) small subunit
MTEFVTVARRDDIPDGGGKVVEVHGRKIALFHSAGRFYAIDNTCGHRGGPLGDGRVYGTRVVCPWHGWEYDFATGTNVNYPTIKLACFPVKIENEDVMVGI